LQSIAIGTNLVAVGYNGSDQPIFTRNTVGYPPSFTGAARMNNTSSVYKMLGATAANSSSRIVAVGHDSSDQAVAAYAATGTTWTTPSLMGGGASGIMTSVVYVPGAGQYVAVGYDSSNAPVYARSSDSGVSWTAPARMNGSSAVAQMQSIISNSSGSLLVAVGYELSQTHNDVDPVVNY
jgi:hypothetical protein